MNVRNVRFSVFSAAIALVLALFVAPSAFARGGHHGGHHGGHGSNWGISLGFVGPGYSIGYSDCRHCGGGYVSGSVYGGYYGPSYYSSYYGPSYYDYYPAYGVSYYSSYPAYYPSYRHYRHGPRRVVHYDGYYRDHDPGRDHRRHDGYYGESRHHDRDYSRRDRGYSSRSAYYDRRN